MSGLKFDIDISSMIKGLEGFKEEIVKDCELAAKTMSKMFHEKVTSLVQENLKGGRRTAYLDSLQKPVEIEKGIWMIELTEGGLDIEDGSAPKPMSWLLNSKNTKTGKNGKYTVIPFLHTKSIVEARINKDDVKEPISKQTIAREIKAELRKRKISPTIIETNEDGSPKTGLIHRFNIDSKKLKPSHKFGPMQGISVYQHTDSGSGKTKKSILTFRTISEKSLAKGNWQYPAVEANNFFEKAYDEVSREFERTIKAEILRKYQG